MKFKKTFINFAAIILTAITFSFAQKEDKDKDTKISFTASVDKRETINGTNFLLIKLSLNNNSFDTLKYIIMSCDYPFNYIINPIRYFAMVDEGCDKNVPELIKIPPQQSIDTLLKLQIDDNFKDEINASFKIGVRLITVANTFDSLIYKRNFLDFYLKNKYAYFSNDTSIKENFKLQTIKNTGYDKLDTTNTIAIVKILWSKDIKL